MHISCIFSLLNVLCALYIIPTHYHTQTDREHAASLMERARDRQPQPDTRRLKLISDMAAENS